MVGSSARSRARTPTLTAIVAAVVLLSAVTALAPATPAAADTFITVTTTSDGGAGSLRAAVDTANAAATPTTIVLAAGATYDLTLCGATEDANTSGDLDLTGAHLVTIDADGAVINQTCSGERVLHSLTGTGGLTIIAATITGGTGTAGIAVYAGASLSLEHSTIRGATGSSSSPAANPAAVATFGTGELSIATSTITDTSNGAGVTDLQTGGTFTISGSTISNNGTASSSLDLAAGGIVGGSRDLTITDSSVTDNNISGLTLPPNPWPPTSMDYQGLAGGISMTASSSPFGLSAVRGTRLRVTGNAGGKSGGIFAVSLDLRDSTVDGNWGYTVGGACCGAAWTGSVPVLPPMTLDQVRITNNRAARGIGGFYGSGSIARSLISGNTGLVGGGDIGPGVNSIERSTITGNVGEVTGGIVVNSDTDSKVDLLLDHVTLAGNVGAASVTQPTSASELGFDLASNSTAGTVTLRSSIVGQPGGSVPVCALQAVTTTSHGANVVGDSSCLTSPLASDATGVVNDLGPLANNGGPTLTRLPAPHSPAIDRQPTSDASCKDDDQRGIARPQGPGCDSGAVEAVKAGYHPLAPERIFDTRTGLGTSRRPLGPGEIRTVEVHGLTQVPQDHVSAVVFNVTADRPTNDSHLTFWPAGIPDPGTSNLNFPAGRTIANLVTVPLGDNRDVQVRNNAGSTEVVIDLAGWYDDGVTDPTSPVVNPASRVAAGPIAPACPCGDGFTPITPARVLDTRPGTTVGGPATPFGPGEARTVQIGGVGGVPADADAVAVNLTVTETTAQSHLTAWPTGATVPEVSNLNWPAGDTIANLAMVKLGPGGTLQLRNNSGSAQVIADVFGWFRSGADGQRFTAIHPVRTLDTRSGLTSPDRFGPGETRTIPGGAPAGAGAVVLNLTGVFGTETTHLTAWPAGTPLPTASNLNLPAGIVRPNAAVTGLASPGAFDLRNNSGSIDVVADLFGYYG